MSNEVMSDGIVRDGMKAGDVVVVTGGGGGFGRAFALRLAAMGGRIAVWEKDAESGAQTAALVKASGGEALFIEVDLADRNDIHRAGAATLAAYGTPYCIINNASIFPRYSILDMDEDVFETTMKVNITASFSIVKFFGPHMIEAGRGVILNIASGRAIGGAPKGIGYASSKGAMLTFTKTVALEWARHNIRCNTIIPGVSFTAQPLADTSEEELVERGRKTIPLGRIGYPEDMAGLAAFLVSADASYMTGQAVAMNGGRILVP
jgi:NAD(P)-dependent dehydrogenase (short-subunit alcohol dehydrogenase family)